MDNIGRPGPHQWRGRRVAVVGLGISNLAVIRYLMKHGAIISGRDKKTLDQLGEIGKELAALPVDLRLGAGYLDGLDQFDALFLTPGIPKHLPELQLAMARGVEIHSEIEIVLAECRAPVIGVTGSSGKTTTTTLVGKMLQAAGLQTFVGGNIGQPLIEQAAHIPLGAWVVLELSSFQLEMLQQSPQAAVVTNVTPNHLDVHASMEEYIAAKEHIFRYQGENDWAIFNKGNTTTRAMAVRAPGQVAFFSREEPVEVGAWVEGDRLLLRRQPHGNVEELGLRQEIVLPGWHNVENVLAAAAVTGLAARLPVAAIREVFTRFRGVPHRLERVDEVDGVLFYNDSIATTPSRALAGIRAVERPIVLIAGGYDKHLPFDELAQEIMRPGGRVRVVVLLGATAGKIAAALERAAVQAGMSGAQTPVVLRAGSFREAVALAGRQARPGDAVLLSPACASYDLFHNFEERGEVFRQLVKERVWQDEAPLAAPATPADQQGV
ncbi:MAG: UDP-N-acetylmuramoyl-L-alanine--D-glutamate ligase [Limnochordaceae bacterium]|nr:UDP-N-acetylmuramoyl-L-alanine--D-glutamate ligase [Limnochordaceae bacterium]